MTHVQISNVSYAHLWREGARIGCLGFGGPAGQIALMHRVFVDERKWLTEDQYLNALNYCMLLPGPEAHQLATYAGWKLRGVPGGLITGLLFVLPGALVVLALSWLYVHKTQVTWLEGAFYGIKAAVLALVVEALIKIGKRALKTRTDLIIAIAAFLALFVFGVSFPLILIAAGALGALRVFSQRRAPTPADAAPPSPVQRAPIGAAILSAVLWLAPLAAAFFWLGPDHVLTEIGALFSQLAVVTFGGAYAVLSYVTTQAVDVNGWIEPHQMIDGLGLAETTPGPLILVNQFVGFLAGWQTDGGGIWLALAGALMASWCTFAPSFLWIFAGAPYAERITANPFAASALKAITAAVLGIVAQVALWFAQHVLFSAQTRLSTPWGKTIELPALGSFDPVSALIAIMAGIALIRFKANVVLIILVCAAIGIAVQEIAFA